MKTFSILFLLFIGAMSVRAAIYTPPSLLDTNTLALSGLAHRVNAMDKYNQFTQGKVERLEQEVDRLEIGMLVLIFINVSTIAVICILAARNRPPRWHFRGYDKGGVSATEKVPTVKPSSG